MDENREHRKDGYAPGLFEMNGKIGNAEQKQVIYACWHDLIKTIFLFL